MKERIESRLDACMVAWSIIRVSVMIVLIFLLACSTYT